MKTMKTLLAVTIAASALLVTPAQAHAYDQRNATTDKVTQGHVKNAQSTSGYVISTDYFYRPDINNTLSNIGNNYSDQTTYSRAKSSVYRQRVVTSGNILMPASLNHATIDRFNAERYISTYKLNQEFMKLLNAERNRQGIPSIRYGSHLLKGSHYRSNQVASNGSLLVNGRAHVNMNGTPAYTAFPYLNKARYRLGENQGSFYYDGNPYRITSERYLAEDMFRSLKNSPAHYRNMMNRQYRSAAITTKLSKKNEYNSRWTYGFYTLTLDNERY